MLYTSGFVDDATFPYNGGNRTEQNTTRIFRPCSSLGSGTSRTSDNVVWSIWPGGGTGDKVCRLRLYIITSEREPEQ